MFETGLGPVFPGNAVCPPIDDYFALDYTFKRGREAYHGGIDIPAHFGAPIIAAADGTVVGKFEGERSKRGIEIILRHAPKESGFPVWIYTGYAHLDKMPNLKFGQRIAKGDIIGPTGNSGISGRRGRKTSNRRPGIHFSAFFSDGRKFTIFRDIVLPENGRWLDPVALYLARMPVESAALKRLPDKDKGVSVPIMFEDGSYSSPNAKFIWPYRCARG